MSKQAGILKVIHAVADVDHDPAPDESLFGLGDTGLVHAAGPGNGSSKSSSG